jgi:hypothetical protein
MAGFAASIGLKVKRNSSSVPRTIDWTSLAFGALLSLRANRCAAARPSLKARALGGATRKEAHMAARAKKKAAPKDKDTKKEAVLSLLRRKSGASIPDLMEATGWQSHSVRGFISGTLKKKLGLKVETTKAEGQERRYQLKTGA